MVPPGEAPPSRSYLGPSGLLCLLPGLLALAGVGVAHGLPRDSVPGQIAISLLLSAPPWLMAAWVPWAGLVAWRTGRRWLPAACALVGLLGVGWPVSWVTSEAPPPAGAWRVLVANVNSFPPDGTDVSVVENQLAAVGADVVVVIERRPESLPGYLRVADNFDAPMERISHASAVFCREGLRCPALVTEEFGSDTMKMPLAIVALEGVGCLLGMHGPPPVPYDPTGLEPHMAHIAGAITEGRLRRAWGPCEAGQPVILAGDLNQVPGSAPFGTLLSAGLVDALDGVGLFGASWPAGGGWLDAPFFRLDQILHASALAVGQVHTHPFDGADHLARSFWVAPR